MKLARSLRHRLCHLHQSLHILSRPTVLSPQESDLLQVSSLQVSLHHISSPTNPLFPMLVQIQGEQGLDESWCLEQLESGSSATIAMIQSRPAGVGMLTRNEFFVGEIDTLYHPGPTAAYLYATYVSPAFRGRRIQRLLDLHRVRQSQQAAAAYAIAIVVSTNTASLRGHAASGFRPAALINHFRLPHCSIILLRKKTSRLPVGNFPASRFSCAPSLHFSRTQ